MDLDNQLKGAQTFFQMRRLNTEYRTAEEGRAMTSEEAYRYARLAVPKQLTAAELDPVTGKISWPMTLQDPQYDVYRNQIERFFVLRETSHGSIGYENFVQNQQVIQSFLANLRKNLDTYRSDDYIAAKNFLDSLRSEAKSPTVSVVSLR